MKALITTTLFTAGVLLSTSPQLFAHGGTYRGPGDTVPPGGSGGGNGGNPVTAGGSTPGGPSGGGANTPGFGTPTGGKGGGTQTGGVTGTGGVDSNLTDWSFWWEFNKDPYIQLKYSLDHQDVKTGSVDWYIGQGTTEQAVNSQRPSKADIQNRIVPALLRALKKESHNDIVTGCMMALAKIGQESDENGSSSFARVMMDFLPDGNQEVSETAAIALGILGNSASIPVLTDLYLDTQAGRKHVGRGEVPIRTRAFAAYGLALCGNRSDNEQHKLAILDTLVQTLESESSSTRDIHVATVIAMGLIPLEKLGVESNLESAEESEGLRLTSRMGQIEYLEEFLQGPEHAYIRAHAPAAITRLLADTHGEAFDTKRDEISRILINTVKAGNDKNAILQSCVMALGQLGDADPKGIDGDIRKTLMDVAANISDKQTRYFASIALAQSGGRIGTEDPEAGIDETASYLLSRMAKGNSEVRQWSAVSVGVLGHALRDRSPESLGDALRIATQDERTPRIGAFAVAAGILNDQSIASVLLDKLERIQDDSARGYLCLSLGMLRAKEATEPIRRIIEESKYRPELLQQAAIALGLMGDDQLVASLIETMNKAGSLSSQAALSSALGFIGDRNSIDPLVTMLENGELSKSARGFAAVALGIIADREPLPWNSKIAVNLNYTAATVTLNDTSGTGILNIL